MAAPHGKRPERTGKGRGNGAGEGNERPSTSTELESTEREDAQIGNLARHNGKGKGHSTGARPALTVTTVKVGDMVEARYREESFGWKPATVVAVGDGGVSVLFDGVSDSTLVPGHPSRIRARAAVGQRHDDGSGKGR